MATSVGATRAVSRGEVLDAVIDLERMAQELAAARLVPGLSVAVVHRDEVVHLAGYGRREIGNEKTPVCEDTVFQLASLSKPLAATVVAALVGDKKLSWDTRIADVDPEFRLHEDYPTAEVTVRDMFAHRSGLSGNAGNDLESLGFSRDDIFEPTALPEAGGQLPRGVPLQQLRPDGRRRRRCEGGRADMGGRR